MKKYKTAKKKLQDKSLITIIHILLVFGIVMIYNSTTVSSFELLGGAYKLIILHVAWVIVGLIGFYFFYNFDFNHIAKIAYLTFFGVLIPLTLLAGIGLLVHAGVLQCTSSFIFAPCLNGANRWLFLNPSPLPRIPLIGVLGFQPGELAKLALILYLSVQLNKNVKSKHTNSFVIFFVTCFLVLLLILLEPNLSTAVMTFLIGTSIYFVSGSPIFSLIFSYIVLSVLAIFSVLISPYRRQRLLTLIHSGGSDNLSVGYHIRQVLIALGNGGWLGLGLGQSKQKFLYLPEVSADSIFAIVGEELGFIGAAALILLFTFVIFKGYSIAEKAENTLGKMLATGITTWIGLQFFINIASMTKLIPLTGVPIPLISYGGSSMVFSLMGLGILANIDKQNQKNL